MLLVPFWAPDVGYSQPVLSFTRRLCIGGSLIGSIKETQEMLDLCGEKNITCEVEVRLSLLWSAVYESTCKI